MKSSSIQLKSNKYYVDIISAAKYFIAVFFAVLALFPFVWVFNNSLKSNSEIYSSPFALPQHMKISNYLQAWSTAKVGTYFLNSIIISVCAVTVTILLASMTSYILARIKPNNRMYTYFTLGLMIPIHAMLIPTFIILRTAGLYNTRPGLAIVYAATNLSISIFILTGFMKGLPRELEESAMIDGAGISRIFFSIILPVSKPGIATIATLSFLNCWNDYLFAQVLISTPNMKTLTQGIANLKGQYSTDYGIMCAGLVIAIIPVTLIYILFQEHVIKGMTAGAIKG